MKRNHASNARELRPLKHRAHEVPHAVIESNYTCNRRCTLCYNRYREIVKPYDQIAREVDQALSMRTVETISILGGEPTLHGDLPAIVRYIKSKNVYCQILTNGVLLFLDRTDALLDRLVEAGLDRIVLHVDRGQGLDDGEMESMRRTLFAKCESRGLTFALSVTLYGDRDESIPLLMKRYAAYRHFDGILSTMPRSANALRLPVEETNHTVDLTAVYRSIKEGLAIEPSSYIPSSLDDEEVRWLMYFYYINAGTGATAAISPHLSRMLRRLYRWMTGRHLFAATVDSSLCPLWFLLSALLESILKPSRLVRFLRLVPGSASLRLIRFQYIVLQSPPQFNASEGCVELCYHCPDATIRNGQLIPVCLADWMSPPRGGRDGNGTDQLLSRTVIGHLEEEGVER